MPPDDLRKKKLKTKSTLRVQVQEAQVVDETQEESYEAPKEDIHQHDLCLDHLRRMLPRQPTTEEV